MKRGRAGTMTHDYKRHGITTLFAALDVVTGKVIGECLPRHRNTKFLKSLRRIDAEVPTGLAVHLILDNYGTHNISTSRAGWLSIPGFICTSPRPRHHGSTSGNAGSATSLTKPCAAMFSGPCPTSSTPIYHCLDAHNTDPKPLVWTATVD